MRVAQTLTRYHLKDGFIKKKISEKHQVKCLEHLFMCKWWKHGRWIRPVRTFFNNMKSAFNYDCDIWTF